MRRELGLRTDCDPVFRDKYSPDLVLALFSHWLAEPQPDWPPQTLQPGFVYFDNEDGVAAASPQLTAFLAAGDAPIVFTQGSTAVHNPGNFYEVSMEAARRLGRRAVLLGAKDRVQNNGADILTLPYAPHSQIFPHGAVNVHQGGSGTTGQALRVGRPMLVVPYGWDQPDNAMRMERLGVALHVPRTKYSIETATNALRKLLHETRFADQAREVGEQMQNEDGLVGACDAIEAVLLQHRIGG